MAPKSVVHTPEQWKAVKPIVQELYLKQDLALNQVMMLMEEQHDFRATWVDASAKA